MDRTEAFLVLGIEATKDERLLKQAYREKLVQTNPEDDPEGFKLLRKAYEEACRSAKEPEEAKQEQAPVPADTTPSGLWLDKAARLYGNIRTRQDPALWKALFDEDVFLSLEEEENCRTKLLWFLTEHFRLPTQVWKLFDKRLSIVKDAAALRERFPGNFMQYMLSRCQRGEDLEFDRFQGPVDADYDKFMEHHDHAFRALQENRLEEAERRLKAADDMGITHPVMEVIRAELLVRQGREREAVSLLEGKLAGSPWDAMLAYHLAELLWNHGGEDGRPRAVQIYQRLKDENDSHYMANVRLTEWHYGEGRYRQAKKCAEKVLAVGSDEAFMDLLVKINAEIEKELEALYRETGRWESGLELCWCYLQDGRISRGIRLARELEELLPPEKDSEYKGLLSKLYVEQAQYRDAIRMTEAWEAALEVRLAGNGTDAEEEEKDRDRLRQARLIRMQSLHSLGFRERENFVLAIREGETILDGGARDVGVLLEMAQIYTEMEEYELSIGISQRLIEEFQVFAAYASLLEAHRRRLDAGGVVRAASQCIRYFPAFVKSYEYLAKVYLDLGRREDFDKVLEDAEQNGVGSVLIEAYRFQMQKNPMDLGSLNDRLKEFRREYFKRVEDGEAGCYERGLPILTEYLYQYPDDFMLVERAIFHRAAHHLKEAREDFEKALYLNPANPYALNGLSFVHKYLGEYEKALFYLKKAILYMDGEMSPVIYADMGNLYALLGDPETAYAAYRQYEGMVGTIKSNEISGNLAWCAMRAGRVDEAASIYERFYEKNAFVRDEKLAELYNAAGQKEKVRQVLRQWRNRISADLTGRMRKLLRGILHPAADRKEAVLSNDSAYYCRKGWTELLYGSRVAAMAAFGRMFRSRMPECSGEEMLGGAVFACILCGRHARGRKYAEKLRERLAMEKCVFKPKYYNRQKKYLQMEFLAAYYTETPEKLQELLDREGSCEICHSCINPMCGGLEGARLLLLLRTGRREEALESLRRNLLTQPWDKYLLAVRHIAFRDEA